MTLSRRRAPFFYILAPFYIFDGSPVQRVFLVKDFAIHPSYKGVIIGKALKDFSSIKCNAKIFSSTVFLRTLCVVHPILVIDWHFYLAKNILRLDRA